MTDNINEVIYRYFVQDEDALPELLHYSRSIAVNEYKSWTGRNHVPRHELDEFISSADLILIECLQSYRTDQQTSFISYYKRALKNWLTDQARRKTGIRYEEEKAISLDCRIGETGSTYLHEIVKDEKAAAPDSFLLRESVAELSQSPDLSDKEREIVEMLLQGYSKKEICEKTKKCYKTIRRTCARFERLLKRHLTDS